MTARADSAGGGQRRPFNAVSQRARTKRGAMLLDSFPDFAEMSIVDLGGTPGWWRAADVRPKAVTVVNLQVARPPEDWISVVRGDACDLPSELRGRDFDLVFSNSLIEHVGGHHRRVQLAETVQSLAAHHWVQTPYRYFPVEPHWMFPGFQFLPVAARAQISRRWRWGHVVPSGDDRRGAVEGVLGVELLSISDLQHYFPQSTIVRERVGGFVKGIIAVS